MLTCKYCSHLLNLIADCQLNGVRGEFRALLDGAFFSLEVFKLGLLPEIKADLSAVTEARCLTASDTAGLSQQLIRTQVYPPKSHFFLRRPRKIQMLQKFNANRDAAI